MLTLIVISIAWLAIVTMLVAVCHTAAHGEEPRTALEKLRSAPIGEKLVLSAPAGGVHCGQRSRSRVRRPPGTGPLARRSRSGQRVR